METGRPSSYNEDVAEEICTRLAGGETLTAICKDNHMPCIMTVFNWTEKHESFLYKYARARRFQIKRMADEVLDLSDNIDEEIDFKNSAVHKRRLQIDTRKWFIGKVVPKMPSLTGTYTQQSAEIVKGLTTGNITNEVAQALMQLLSAQANFVSLDEFKKELTAIKEGISKSNSIKTGEENCLEKDVA